MPENHDLKGRPIEMYSLPGVGTKRARALMKFAKGQNDTETATLAECIAWVTRFPKIHQKSRPEGWGNMTVMNFLTTLGMNKGEYIDFRTDIEPKKETNKNGRK